MPYLSDLEANPESRISALLIGPSGSGKTGAACSFPTPFDRDFDGRIRGVLGCPWLKGKKIGYKYYPPKVHAPKNSVSAPVWEALNNDLQLDLMNYAMNNSEWKTHIFDSLTAMCLAFVLDALPVTHTEGGRNEKKAGKFIGKMPMAGPDDYNFESTGCAGVLAYIRSIPGINYIATVHNIPKFKKSDPDNPYSESVPDGTKLAIRDKIGAIIPTYFDHVFEFEKRVNGSDIRYIVTTQSELARTTFSALPRELDITGKNFYELLLSYAKPEELKKEVTA